MISKFFVNIITGFVLILWGVIDIRYVYKKPAPDFKYTDYGLYIAGGLSIIIGLACLFGFGGDLTDSIYEEINERLK